MLRDEYGDVSLIVSHKPCPRCGAQTVKLREPKQPLPVQIVVAVREADLAPEEITRLARALREAAPDTSPREVVERAQVPAASKLITVASRAGQEWIALLGLVLAVVAIYVAHSDAKQAHQDAEKAIRQEREDAERALREARQQPRSTGTLSEEEIRGIAEQIERRLGADE